MQTILIYTCLLYQTIHDNLTLISILTLLALSMHLWIHTSAGEYIIAQSFKMNELNLDARAMGDNNSKYNTIYTDMTDLTSLTARQR